MGGRTSTTTTVTPMKGQCNSRLVYPPEPSWHDGMNVGMARVEAPGCGEACEELKRGETRGDSENGTNDRIDEEMDIWAPTWWVEGNRLL